MRLLSAFLMSAALLLSFQPARAAEADCARPSGSPPLVGSHWAGQTVWDTGETRTWTLLLRPDCVAEYNYDGVTYTNGRWLQRGDMLVMDTNDYFATYLGHLVSGRLNGVMFNQKGARGSWSFSRTD